MTPTGTWAGSVAQEGYRLLCKSWSGVACIATIGGVWNCGIGCDEQVMLTTLKAIETVQ